MELIESQDDKRRKEISEGKRGLSRCFWIVEAIKLLYDVDPIGTNRQSKEEAEEDIDGLVEEDMYTDNQGYSGMYGDPMDPVDDK